MAQDISSEQNAAPAGAKDKAAHLWDRGPDDWYVEEEWCNASLLSNPIFLQEIADASVEKPIVVDPFCGRGRVLDAASAAGFRVLGLDKVDRGASARHPFVLADFVGLNIGTYIPAGSSFIIIANPPYNGGIPTAKPDPRACRALVRRVVTESDAPVVALLLRSKWANAGDNSRLLEQLPLKHILAFSPRPSMPTGAFVLAAERGDLDPRTGKPCKVGGGQEDYFYYVFRRGYSGARAFSWLRKPPKPKKEFRP